MVKVTFLVKNTMKTIIYTHQGWTDIINCLSLINYYSKIRNHIVFVVRDDGGDLCRYYTKHLNNVEIHGISKHTLDTEGLSLIPNLYPNGEYIFFGSHDVVSSDDTRKGKFSHIGGDDFVEKFYTSYDLDYNIRVDEFELERNYELENSLYQKFVEDHGENYTLTHKIDKNKFIDWEGLPHPTVSGDDSIKTVELHALSDRFFDTIKILENAKEMYLLDSVWAAIVYLLDCKYGIFENKNIIVGCERGHFAMFKRPKELSNWTIVG